MSYLEILLIVYCSVFERIEKFYWMDRVVERQANGSYIALGLLVLDYFVFEGGFY